MNTNVNWGWIAITLSINIVISILAYLLTIRVILKMKPMFIKARIFGIDMNKPNVKSFEKSGDSIVQIKMYVHYLLLNISYHYHNNFAYNFIQIMK